MLPSVQPGYLHTLLPTEVPEEAENWRDVMKDFDHLIMPGITHWQSPNFHAYYPTQTSYPSMVGDLLGNGLGLVGFSWVSFEHSIFIASSILTLFLCTDLQSSMY